MLSYVVIHRCVDKKLHDNKLNTAVDKLLVDFDCRSFNAAEGVKSNKMANTILANVNRIDKITKNFAFIPKEGNVSSNIDSMGE